MRILTMSGMVVLCAWLPAHRPNLHNSERAISITSYWYLRKQHRGLLFTAK